MRRPGMDDDVTLDTETYYVTVVGHLQLSNYPISVSRAFFFIAFHARLKLHFQVLSKILTCFLNKWKAVWKIPSVISFPISSIFLQNELLFLIQHPPENVLILVEKRKSHFIYLYLYRCPSIRENERELKWMTFSTGDLANDFYNQKNYFHRYVSFSRVFLAKIQSLQRLFMDSFSRSISPDIRQLAIV